MTYQYICLRFINILLAQADGQSQDEAAEETVEMFTDSGYDVSRVWVCRSKADLDEKMTAQSSVEQVQKSARGEDSYLNGSFSLAKLRRICKAQAGPDDTGTVRYSRFFIIIIIIISIVCVHILQEFGGSSMHRTF